MKKLLAITLGLAAFVAFAFKSPNKATVQSPILDELPLVITLEGIEDGQTANLYENAFLSETE